MPTPRCLTTPLPSAVSHHPSFPPPGTRPPSRRARTSGSSRSCASRCVVSRVESALIEKKAGIFPLNCLVSPARNPDTHQRTTRASLATSLASRDLGGAAREKPPRGGGRKQGVGTRIYNNRQRKQRAILANQHVQRAGAAAGGRGARRGPRGGWGVGGGGATYRRPQRVQRLTRQPSALHPPQPSPQPNPYRVPLTAYALGSCASEATQGCVGRL